LFLSFLLSFLRSCFFLYFFLSFLHSFLLSCVLTFFFSSRISLILRNVNIFLVPEIRDENGNFF
jgi:hypothetical protein